MSHYSNGLSKSKQLKPSTIVKIHGLKSEAGQKLNNLWGVVSKFSDGRYTITINTSSSLPTMQAWTTHRAAENTAEMPTRRIKRENLLPASHHPCNGPNCIDAKTPPHFKKLTRCSSCKLTLYCSKKCQRDDWKQHKPYCKRVCKDKKPLDQIRNGYKTIEKLIPVGMYDVKKGSFPLNIHDGSVAGSLSLFDYLMWHRHKYGHGAVNLTFPTEADLTNYICLLMNGSTATPYQVAYSYLPYPFNNACQGETVHPMSANWEETTSLGSVIGVNGSIRHAFDAVQKTIDTNGSMSSSNIFTAHVICDTRLADNQSFLKVFTMQLNTNYQAPKTNHFKQKPKITGHRSKQMKCSDYLKDFARLFVMDPKYAKCRALVWKLFGVAKTFMDFPVMVLTRINIAIDSGVWEIKDLKKVSPKQLEKKLRKDVKQYEKVKQFAMAGNEAGYKAGLQLEKFGCVALDQRQIIEICPQGNANWEHYFGPKAKPFPVDPTKSVMLLVQAFVQKDDDLVIGQPILFGRDKKYPLNLPCGDFRSNLINANGEFMPNAY